MKKVSIFIAITFLFFIISACSDNKNDSLILGNWQGAEWLANGKPTENNAQSTSFTFNEKGEYSFVNGGNTEKGSYKIDSDMLFTTPEGKQEIMVKIAKLTKDSLVFEMNRGGQAESLVLLKK
jgi:hypothetical protein